MKKKILSLCVVMALAVTAIIGGTLAYFSDTDAQTNTFTTGNVEIDLWEDFGDNDATGVEELIPSTGSYDDGTLKNDIEKEIYVTNKGSEDAFVRVHIAIPSILEDANDEFDANEGVLHFAIADNSAELDKWDWSNATDDDDYETKSNTYKTTIDNKEYNVYVVTYTSALIKDAATVDAISKVWMDSATTNEDITKINEVLGAEWKIYVAAEGTQTQGFADAYEALNTAFGEPTDATYTATIDWTTVAGQSFVNKD